MRVRLQVVRVPSQVAPARLRSVPGQARPCRVTPGRADPSCVQGTTKVTMVESTNTPDPTQGQAPGQQASPQPAQQAVVNARTQGQTAKPSHKRSGLTTGSAAEALRWCGGSTRRQTILHVGPPISPRPEASVRTTAGTPVVGVPARCMCGRPRWPALRGRVSITPRKPDGVNLRFATDRPLSLADSPEACYTVRLDPVESLHVRPIMCGKPPRRPIIWDCYLS